MNNNDIIKKNWMKNNKKIVMASSDWCESWQKNHPDTNCDPCPHSDTCKEYAIYLNDIFSNRAGGKR